MKRMFWAIAALTIASTSAIASNSTAPVQISSINYASTGIVTVFVSITPGTNAPITGIPSCVSPHNIGNTYDYVFDSTTAAGKSLLAGLVAYHTAGTSIWVTGTGDCGVSSGNETLQAFIG